MSLISLPYTFTNDSGSIPLADLDANFAAILAVVNGGIDQTNLSSSFNPVFSSLTVNGPASISGTLSAGDGSLSSLTVAGNETVNGNLSVLGTITQGVAGTSGGITGGTASNGYNTHPDGFIEQWAFMTASAGGSTTWTFPLTFPHTYFTAIATCESNASPNETYVVNIASLTNSGLTFYVNFVEGGGAMGYSAINVWLKVTGN